MSTVLITPPSETPVTADDLGKLALRVDGAEEDALIDIYIAAAVEYAQAYSQRQFMQATYELRVKCWPSSIVLIKAPLVSVVDIKYDDEENAEQTLATALYQVDNSAEPGCIKFIGSLPSVYDKPNAIRIRYIAGYGGAGADITVQRAAVPACAKVAMLKRVGDYFENRQNEIQGTTVAKFSDSSDRQLDQIRLYL